MMTESEVQLLWYTLTKILGFIAMITGGYRAIKYRTTSTIDQRVADIILMAAGLGMFFATDYVLLVLGFWK